jgi:demethylmenaquinone methyltransferase/2-methoxy-6-polyprenyl-1,4-benzoquinol methylase
VEKKKPIGVEIFDRIADRYDALSSFFSLGIIKRWQRELVKGLTGGERVLDLACGTGEVAGMVHHLFDECVGLDYSLPMLEVAKRKYPQISWVRGDALSTPFKDSTFDVVLVSLGLRHFEKTGEALREIYRILKSGGEARILEVATPRNPLLDKLFRFFLKNVMLPIGKLRSKEDITHHLYTTIVNFPHYEALVKLAKECGFREGSFKPLMGGMAAIYRFTKE